MMIFRSLRAGTGILALGAVMFLMAAHVGGCSDETSPTEAATAQAPALPDAADLQIDLGFFDGAGTLAKDASGIHDNFVNAYLRAVVLQTMADFTLAAPVGTFAVALHTVPAAQPDGAWVWSYTWTGYRFPIRVALRGLPAGDHVAWEMRISPLNTEPNLLWFEGTTSDQGRKGQWLFHDLDDPAHPVSGEIAWDHDASGRWLQFTSRELESDGDLLRFTDGAPDYAIEFTPGDGGVASYIRWNADGTGSLLVPDYNGGAAACWDRWQENVVCD